MPDPLLYLKSMGIAAIVSAAIVLAMAAARRGSATTWLNFACIAGIGAGIVAGNGVLSLRPAWPPSNGLDRFLILVIPAALAIELIAGLPRVPASAAAFLRVSLALAIPRILLHGSTYLDGHEPNWAPWQVALVLAVGGALLATVRGLLVTLSQRSPEDVTISAAIVLATLSAGLCVMMAGYIKGGAVALPLATTLAAATIAARWIAKLPLPSIVGLGVVNLFGVLFIGRFFGRLSTTGAMILYLVPLLCWTTELPGLRRQQPWIVGSIRLALVAVPVLAVLALAKRDFDHKMAPLLGNRRSIPHFNRTESSGTWHGAVVPFLMERTNRRG